ncbi:hypothetical protein ACE1TF_06765 [Geomicrobium sp. JSM 1781026]|uniref:hypothetical protein n=1 Tax=unclassified Geomicrobium TaxID=2628951 RepID=UPI00045F1123|nr:hypothetical protein [Geomicrobium sp. JCM 19039]GAK14076.1 hypothetical protein JCM19039_3971 [Geomicrobium sp. JCM 19039]
MDKEEEILEEIRGLRQDLAEERKKKGLSPVLAIGAVILGFTIIGPIVGMFITSFFG